VVVVSDIVVGHPGDGALVVFGVSRGRHHHVVDPLLGFVGVRRVVTDMVGFVPRVFFHSNVGSVQVAVLYFASGEGVGCVSVGDSVFHETVIFFDVGLGPGVSPDVDVFNWVSVGELQERTHGVHPRVGHCAGLEADGSSAGKWKRKLTFEPTVAGIEFGRGRRSTTLI